jgi:hypothetical protein
MTPPVVDPLHADAGPAPTPEPLPQTPPATVTAPTPNPVTPVAAPAPQPTGDSSASSYDPNGFLGRFHFVLGGGYNFGTRINPSAEPFSSAAPSYNGGSLYFQPSYSLLPPTGLFDLRLGASLATHILSIPRTPGSTSSSANALALAGLVEGNLNIHQHFGIGLNAGLGYMGLMSSDADVGAPFTATFDWGDQGGLYVGAQLYVSTFNQAIRAGVALDSMPTGFGLPTAPGQPDFLVGYGPTWTIFAGVDPFRIVDFVQRGSRSSADTSAPAPASR